MTHALRGRAPVGLTAIAVLCLPVVAACGSSSDSAATKPAPTASSLAALQVQQAALNTQDLAPGNSVSLAPGGEDVADAVTLDYCGFNYETEAHRTARRQVIIYVKKQVVASNEVVAYDTPAQAALALTELRTAVAKCPIGVVRASTVADAPAARYLSSRQVPDDALPVSDNAVVTASATYQGQKQKMYQIAIYQRRNNVLDVLYLKPTPKLTAKDKATATELATTTGQKLGAES